VGIDPRQLRVEIIRPALQDVGLWSEAAEELILGTICQESQCGRYLTQIKGPALGICQMEPATYRDLWANFLEWKQGLCEKILNASGFPYGSRPGAEDMIYNLRFAVLMCRVYYLRIPAPLPPAGDLEAQARYWKLYYNTPKGRGTVAQYVKNYRGGSYA